MALESVFHVTVASNFARAFDKYSRVYDKAAILQSTFPNQFFVLKHDELHIGLDKARALLARLALPGDRLLVLQAELDPATLHANLRTGRGRYLTGTRLPVHAVHWVAAGGELEPTCVEEALALSLRLLEPEFHPYEQLKPRTVSVLPVAHACQAACRFCFSESSASLDQAAHSIDVARVAPWVQAAAARGAERFVITGGGEPGLLVHENLVELIRAGRRHLPKAVLITNGIHLSKSKIGIQQVISDYAQAGLSVLAISRHHHDPAVNAAIMGRETGTEHVLQALRDHPGPAPAARLICVLQEGGVATPADIQDYLRWAVAHGVPEVCFKELYISTTLESAYAAQPENAWSRAHQVPLSLLLQVLADMGFTEAGRLPWGATVHRGTVDGKPVSVAAYSEPSLYWERVHGVARSWNLMADGRCLASLEDNASEVAPPAGLTPRKTILIAPDRRP